MKKWTILLLALSSVFMSGCSLSNRVESNEGSITLQLNEQQLQYYDYLPEEIPMFTLEFDGIVYTNVAVKNDYEVVFAGNDDFYLSSILSDFFDDYRHLEGRFSTAILSEGEQFETQMNSYEVVEGEKVFKKHFLKVEGNRVYNEIAYIILDNGLQLSIQYRRFQAKNEVDELITYYAWLYTSSIRMVLHFPSMVIQREQGERKLILLPLYNQTLYTIGADKNLESILTKDTYFEDDSYRTFRYPNYSGAIDAKPIVTEDEIALVKAYYNDYMQGYEEAGRFYMQYLGNHFEVHFEDQTYTISYLGKVTP